MDLIKKRMGLYDHMVGLLDEYMKKLSGAFNNVYEIVNTNKQKITIAKEIMNSYDTSDAFKLLSMSNSVYSILCSVYEDLSFDISSMPSQMSNTYILNISKYHVKLSSCISAINGEIKKSDPELIRKLFGEIKDKPIDEVYKLFCDNINAVNLYAFYLQHKLNTVDKNSTEYGKVLTNIENAKDKILLSPGRNYKHDIMQRYSIVPAYQHMSLQSIFSKVLSVVNYINRDNVVIRGGGVFANPQLDDISKKFAEKKIGLYVMVNIFDNQIEYNMQNIMIKKLSRKIPIGRNSGITGELIHKFNILNDINKGVGYFNMNLRKRRCRFG